MTQVTLQGRSVELAPHVLGMLDVQGGLHAILQTAIRLKKNRHDLPPLLDGKSVLMIFEKNSTRTRVSFELGVQKLGGSTVVLDGPNTQMARGELMEDTAKVLARYADAIVYRANLHKDVAEMAKHSTAPVINALTELEHPCQILADLMTLQERWGDLRGRRFAYVGDGNNVCNSYILGAAMVGMDIHVATPAGFTPDANIVEEAEVIAKMNQCTVTLCNDPLEAVTGADVVATDTWISMGDEAEEAVRRAAFQAYTVDDAMMDHAGPEALFMHCLPGHWGEEATYEVAHGPRSVIYDEAENRMWAQMALLVHLIGDAQRL